MPDDVAALSRAEFDALTAACDALLSANGSSSVHAVAWLHVLHAHPAQLAGYREVFATGRPERWSIGHVLRALWGLARSIVAGRSVRMPRAMRPGGVLFVSHLVNESHASASTDFYFGALPDAVSAAGADVGVVLLNHTRARAARLTWRWPPGAGIVRLVLPRFAPVMLEVRVLASLVREAVRLTQVGRTGSALAGRVSMIAAREALSPASIGSLRLFHQIREAVAQTRPSAVVLTWEGHAWERLAVAAARGVMPTAMCVGYQHTVLFPNQHAIQRRLGQGHDPDVVLTVGDINRDVLRATWGGDVRTVGSSRRLADGGAGPDQGDRPLRCVVIPEGLPSEVEVLAQFALRLAERAPDVQLVLRMHPVLSWDAFVAARPAWRRLPSNVVLSATPDLIEEFRRCRWVLYRGSSAVVHAVREGARPLYVEGDEALPLDPLEALNAWRRKVRGVNEALGIIRGDQQTPVSILADEWRPARAFADAYMRPLDPRVLLDVLRLGGPGRSD